MNAITILLAALAGLARSEGGPFHSGNGVSKVVGPPGAAVSEDPRTWQHGIDFVQLPNGDGWLIWSSAGNPPVVRPNTSAWTHDVFASRIDPTAPMIQPRTLIQRPEAQEPASSAINSDGHIFVTMEDGWNVHNTVGQRFGLYDQDLSPIRPYPRMVLDGGHSGHVAAVGRNFVVFYSEGWVDGGGVDDLGTGDDVWVDTFDSFGNRRGHLEVAVGSATRDGWPLVAGSGDRALLVWQRFVPDATYVDLMVAVFDPNTGNLIVPPRKLEGFTRYYTFDVQFLPSLNDFLLLASWQDETDGFAYLLDGHADVLAAHLSIPRPVREGQPALRAEGSGALVVYPSVPNTLTKLLVTPSEIRLAGKLEVPLTWSEIGTDGIFLDPDTLFFAGLSKRGIRSVRRHL